MEIKINKLIPKPLTDIPDLDSEIWLKEETVFSSGSRNIIYSQSGKGKTSLLSIFYGIRTDYNGDVFFDGGNIRDLSYNQWVKIRREKLSFVFQGLNLFENLTVAENIALKNRLTGYYNVQQIKEMAERVGIAELWNSKAGKISFGQQQRVAVVRALCQPFENILLDEPFSHLDIENQSVVFDLIVEKAGEKGAGIILTSLSGDTGKNMTDFNYYRI